MIKLEKSMFASLNLCILVCAFLERFSEVPHVSQRHLNFLFSYFICGGLCALSLSGGSTYSAIGTPVNLRHYN